MLQLGLIAGFNATLMYLFTYVCITVVFLFIYGDEKTPKNVTCKLFGKCFKTQTYSNSTGQYHDRNKRASFCQCDLIWNLIHVDLTLSWPVTSALCLTRTVQDLHLAYPIATADAAVSTRPCPGLSRRRRARQGTVLDLHLANPTPTADAAVSTRTCPGLSRRRRAR